MQRVMIFVDYWNFVTNLNTLQYGFKIDWDAKLRDYLMEQVKNIVNDECSYSGMFVCGSYNPTKDDTTGKIKDSTYMWANQTLPKFKGVTVRFKPRQAQNSRNLYCNNCNTTVSACPNCKHPFSGYVEKGVDTEIVIEMFSLPNYDIAVLVSDDRDFVAAVQALRTKGIKVIHGRPSLNGGFDLDKECFDVIEIGKNRNQFERA
ncbi:NYN domain-containing protein [Cloacibacillus evryensis]|uniref:NYN domain-containing protein n=1 Tax=Cloacibacillus evryensis TaxID=508460 RepID=UPI002B20273A|nr:NYN domain-containing protein [Cloacibacillus evryensis]MEA5034224.1 NYN domain-containing protein [Cloacibacillus evryensis]